MTGGIGFTRDGNNSLKRNRSILNPRKKNTQNPYWGFKKSTKRKIDNYRELVNWKIKKHSRYKRETIIASLIIISAIISLLLYITVL